MPDLAGEAVTPDLDPPIDDETSPDSGPQRDHDHVPVAPGRTQAVLGQHGQVGVVLYDDPAAGEPLPHQHLPVHPLGLRQVGRETERTFLVQHSWSTDADGDADGGRAPGALFEPWAP